MARKVLALDLRDEPDNLTAYDIAHQPGGVWPEVIDDLRTRGYEAMTIWRVGNRLMMIVDYDPTASAPVLDSALTARLAAWESAMSQRQQSLQGPTVAPAWVEMECVFDLAAH